MSPHDLPALIEAIRERHSCEATFLESVSVVLALEGGPVWKGDVHVFDVSGHPFALRCYAWSETGEGGERKLFTVPAVGPVRSATDAVRAAIAEGTKREGQGGESIGMGQGPEDPTGGMGVPRSSATGS
jgi:hypothetical protein